MNYTLYCVGDRGAATDEGFVLPFLVLMAAHVLIVTVVILVAGLWSRLRTDPPEDSPTDVVEY
ncbi:hypothetical protein OHB12_02780 [Nocardia sp. NBC_01730]|uniref:hypothetical protein n=1 Tax=Nocardia sp. NBC_01730 TaxID=2975998 RepID=UPI002E126A81|nr:hypothetical protein OHB12_02780 [Nocardia sp. NBC_01730]